MLNIDWANLTLLNSFIGGILIGIAAIIIFLVNGKIIKKPNKSVAKPGKINKNAATANAAPDINSKKGI